MSDFGQCFRAFLKQKNLTQVEAAARFGWTQRTVSYYCNSKKSPRPHILEHISSRLDVPVEQLLGQTAAPNLTRETHHIYNAPPVAALEALRADYQAADPDHQAVIRADLRRLFPRHHKHLEAWLKLGKTPSKAAQT